MREVHLGVVAPETKMICVKIELRDTDIRRTIIVPENLTLEDFSDVIQYAVGWDGSHPWKFCQGKDVDWYCDVYEDEPKPMKMPWLQERWHQAPCEHTIGEVLDKKGKRLYYTYDFGDSWEHVVYRMSDPKKGALPCCEKTCGTWGVDDVGGSWGLNSVVVSLRKWDKDCTDEECREGELSGDRRFWYGWGKKAEREKFLAGPTADEVTARLSELFTDSNDTPLGEFVVDEDGVVHEVDEDGVVHEIESVPQNTIVSSGKSSKIGRNDPRPCGSGRKFKKCCGR